MDSGSSAGRLNPAAPLINATEPPLIGRRTATSTLLALGVTALAAAALAARVVPRTWRQLAEDVVRRAHDLSRDVAEGRLSQTAWQDAMADLLRGVDAEDLSRSIGIDGLVARAKDVERGAAVIPVEIAPEGFALSPQFSVNLLLLERGRANPPHAHDNMVSVHYVLRGRVRARHYDRVRNEPAHVVLRSTIDRVLESGEATSISDARDNVHWHAAETESVLLDIARVGLDASRPTSTQFVDPERAEPIGDGLLRAPRLSGAEEALARFG